MGAPWSVGRVKGIGRVYYNYYYNYLKKKLRDQLGKS